MDDLEPLLTKGRSQGICRWVVPGVDCARWEHLLATVEQYAELHVAPGVHPRFADHYNASRAAQLRKLLQHPKAVAVGEVGLDRLLEVPWQVQEEVFIKMIRLALETDKPLLIHSRKSTERVLHLLQREKVDRSKAIFHAYSGSLETARKIVDAGYLIGIGGAVTWLNAKRLPRVVREIPAAAMVLETDAPDMTPVPYRGQPNRPAYLTIIAEKVAALRGWSVAETARVTTENARRVLLFHDRE